MSIPVSLKRLDLPSPGSQQIAAAPLAHTAGARVILGAASTREYSATPIVPGASSLFAPRGACLGNEHGPLIVSDTGHHRLLFWRRAPDHDNAPADFLIGQGSFSSEGRNAGGDVGPATLNVPTGVSTDGHVLAVADAWNHRVLLWHGLPESSNQTADVVLGQRDFRSAGANRGLEAPAADTLNWCYGVALHNGGLFVADTGNRRVLVWNIIPERSGQPADIVLGQRDFVTRDESAGGLDSIGMRWPHAVASASGRLMVADAGSSRIMVWNEVPDRSGAPCDHVLGQASMKDTAHNRSAYDPSAASLNMPYGLAVQQGRRLIVADTANSRLLGYSLDTLATGQSAAWLAGQHSFVERGDNRWRPAARDSLCWPYAVTACGNTLVIADSGNNRVLLWDAT